MWFTRASLWFTRTLQRLAVVAMVPYSNSFSHKPFPHPPPHTIIPLSPFVQELHILVFCPAQSGCSRVSKASLLRGFGIIKGINGDDAGLQEEKPFPFSLLVCIEGVPSRFGIYLWERETGGQANTWRLRSTSRLILPPTKHYIPFFFYSQLETTSFIHLLCIMKKREKTVKIQKIQKPREAVDKKNTRNKIRSIVSGV